MQTKTGGNVSDLVTALRVTLALLFALSSIGKLLAYRHFILVVEDYALLSHRPAQLVGTLVPWVELLVALWLLANVATAIAASLASALVAVFTVAVIATLHRGLAPECGCFGVLAETRVSWGTVARNGALLFLCFALVVTSAWQSLHGGGALFQPFAFLGNDYQQAAALVAFALPVLVALNLLEQAVSLEQVRTSSVHHPALLRTASRRLRQAGESVNRLITIGKENER